MKKTEKWLFIPALIVLAAAALGLLVFALVRFFALRSAGEGTLRLLWEVLPALTVLLLFAFATLFLFLKTKKSAADLDAEIGKISQRVANGAPCGSIPAAGSLGLPAASLPQEEQTLIATFSEAKAGADAAATEREQSAAALKICRSTTPEEIDFGGLRYAVCAQTLYSPAVGANFAEAFPLDGRRVFVAVGDVWGSGLDAALFSSRVKSLLRENILCGRNTAETLTAVNAALCAENSGTYAATLFCAVFHCDSGELRYANAGHYPPVVTGDTAGFLRVCAGTPLGLYADAQFTEEVFVLQPEHGLFLYTDGAVNGSDGQERFGYDRLLAVLKALGGSALGADRVTEGMTAALTEFCGQTPDVSELMLSFPGGTQRLFHAKLAEAEGLRTFLSEWLGGDPRKSGILSFCTELFAGIVKHAAARAIRVGCEKGDGHLTIRFTDDGEPFNPLQTQEGTNRDAELKKIGGEIFYRTKQALNVLTVRFPLGAIG